MADSKFEIIDIDKTQERQEDKSKRMQFILIVVLADIILVALVVYFTFFASAERKQIVITEVVTSNCLSFVDETLGTPDWIELYNNSNFDISLKGYGISDVTALPFRYEFSDVTIGAGEYLVVYATADRGTDDICLGFGLSKDGETIYLTNPNGEPVQMLIVPELRKDMSWGLAEDRTYKYIAQPSPGVKNSDITAETIDGFEWLQKKSAVMINELMPTKSKLQYGAAEKYAWVELYNTSDEAVSLKNFFLSDDPENLIKWQFPDIDVESYGYIVVYISGENRKDSELHTDFSLSSGEQTIYLSDGNLGLTMDISWDEQMNKNYSIGIDEDGEVKYFSEPTLGQANTTSAFDSYEYSEMAAGLCVNEILLDNTYSSIDMDGDRPAWIEFYNSSASTIYLGDYYLSDRGSNAYKWRFADTWLEAGEYLTVFLSGKDRREDELHTSFKIGEDEFELYITNRKTAEQAVFSLGFDVMENVSYGKSGDGIWRYFGRPTPGEENTSNGFDEITDAKCFDIDGIYINEVSAVGEPKSGDLDWIEIRNGTDSSINLDGYFLSDNLNDPLMWRISDITINAAGYGVIYVSSKPSEQTESTAPFSISAAGEELLLSDPNGVLIDYFETGVIYEGYSVGRLGGDKTGSRVFFTSTTKGIANADVYYTAYTKKPEFSQQGGYTAKNTIVEITCDEPAATIYYTTNGDKPTTSSRLYEGGIKVTGSIPIRAVAVAPDKLPSPIETNNYIVDEEHDIAMLCISGDQRDINYTYSSTNANREVEAHIEYYEKDGTIGTAFPAGIRVTGLISRSYAQKSLKIFLRGGYGQSSVIYPFFESHSITEFRSLTIRNSGQDLYYAHMKTAFFEMAVNGLDVDNAQQKPVAVYINGKYWGLYWLCENQNEDHFATEYGFDREDIEIIRRNYSVVAGNSKEFLAVRKFARTHDLGIEEYYDEFITMVDERAFMDYVIIQTYINNWDMYNQKYWRTVDYEHEWRPIFFDLDYAFRYPNACYLGYYFSKYGVTWTGGDQSKTNMDIYYALLQNEGWKQAFIERYAYLLQTTFSPETIVPLFDSMVAEVESEMEKQIYRWRVPNSMKSWRNETEKLRDILLKRAAKCKKDLQSYFHLSDERMAELFPNDG